MAKYRVHLDWGIWGVEAAARRSDIIAIVDALSFSTSVVLACHNGAAVYPAPDYESAHALVDEYGATLAVGRDDVPARGLFSLSPVTMKSAEANDKIVLRSVNGANCATASSGCHYVFAAALTNASAAARKLRELLVSKGHNVTIIACGERIGQGGRHTPIRMAIEDYYAAGMIISKINAAMSVEARLCAATFEGMKADPSTILWDCESGLELRERGYPEDVRTAAQIDIVDNVPSFADGCFH